MPRSQVSIVPLLRPAARITPSDDNPRAVTHEPASVSTRTAEPLSSVLFFDFGTEGWLGAEVPLVVFWLFAGAVFFTLRMRFINVRGFWHAIRVTADGPRILVELDGKQVLAFEDDEYASGQICLQGEKDGVLYRYIKVTELR